MFALSRKSLVLRRSFDRRRFVAVAALLIDLRSDGMAQRAYDSFP